MRDSFLDCLSDVATRTSTLKTSWLLKTMIVQSWLHSISCTSTIIWTANSTKCNPMICFGSTFLDQVGNWEMSKMSKTFLLTGCMPCLLKSSNPVPTSPCIPAISCGMRISCGQPKPFLIWLRMKPWSFGSSLNWTDMRRSTAWVHWHCTSPCMRLNFVLHE